MASVKELEFALKNMNIESSQSCDYLDKVFSDIVSDNSSDLVSSLQMVEDFLIQSLDSQSQATKELKKSA